MIKAVRALLAILAAILLVASVPTPTVTQAPVQWRIADPDIPDGG